MRWHKCVENWSESLRGTVPPVVVHHIRASLASLPSFLIHCCKKKQGGGGGGGDFYIQSGVYLNLNSCIVLLSLSKKPKVRYNL